MNLYQFTAAFGECSRALADASERVSSLEGKASHEVEREARPFCAKAACTCLCRRWAEPVDNNRRRLENTVKVQRLKPSRLL